MPNPTRHDLARRGPVPEAVSLWTLLAHHWLTSEQRDAEAAAGVPGGPARPVSAGDCRCA